MISLQNGAGQGESQRNHDGSGMATFFATGASSGPQQFSPSPPRNMAKDICYEGSMEFTILDATIQLIAYASSISSADLIPLHR